MSKMQKPIKIQWIYEGEPGHWHSAEGRFTISGNGYRNGVTPDFYELHDEIQALRNRVKNITSTTPAQSFDSVSSAKREAWARIMAENENI